MPKLKKVIAGLALGTALAGGALAVSATAASATTAPSDFFGNRFGNDRCSDMDDLYWDLYVAGNCCDRGCSY
ncbi:hypothetical protein JOL79_20670 [Microbispora sp. RL4-1S]|uniref:Secreted protein n=1 Tax=Microbispora oryzae TaxID=2806554 RepID=A0A941AKM3_9ACTN|nr:hypothetical protein [Microbispora oryzae]MBP2706227.1 hypothetical protein [Microbispora oryzae]